MACRWLTAGAYGSCLTLARWACGVPVAYLGAYGSCLILARWACGVSVAYLGAYGSCLTLPQWACDVSVAYLRIRLVLAFRSLRYPHQARRPRPDGPHVHREGVLVRRRRQRQAVVLAFTECRAGEPNPLAALVVEVCRPLELHGHDVCGKDAAEVIRD